MKIERFHHLAEAYGAEIDRWPPHERAAARALAARSPEARGALARAAILDAWLSLPAQREAASGAAEAQAERVFAAIAARIDRPAPGAGAAWRRVPALVGGLPRSVLPAAGFLVLMGLFGFTLGRTGLVELPGGPGAGYISLVASNSQPIAWDQ